jgi:predicted nucleotide-binding protein (sugar kinase/HSP70/actin superfamily)
MEQVIGVPRGLDYYLFYPFWQHFLASLGLGTVVSPPTNKAIVDLGATHAVDGCCLPLKVYLGHVLTLAEQGITAFFVPRIVGIARREYICPYFLGLPDFISHYLPRKGTEVISPVVDFRRGELAAAKELIRFGARYVPWPEAARAYYSAWLAFRSWRQRQITAVAPERLTVLVLGHRYLVDDSFLNQGVMGRLHQAGAQAITSYQLPEAFLSKGAKRLGKRMFWTSGRQSLGALEECLGKVDGVITLAAFACGTDSLVTDLIQRRARQAGVPNLLLCVDEQTGEAGIGTRLEAFVDMLVRSKQR